MHCICVAKEVVEVAQYFLICAYEEHCNVIGLVGVELMYWQVVGTIGGGDEVLDLSIRIARYVLQRCVAFGLLVEAVYRDDGEDLINCPRVGK